MKLLQDFEGAGVVFPGGADVAAAWPSRTDGYLTSNVAMTG
jgi:hypothetical protein